ncbi:MAG: translation initiation factor IF-2 [Candidatus Pacebacteria bacterium]|nr:translation initiation factor IF-2 [Candidatus Paceibacterota bacterium]
MSTTSETKSIIRPPVIVIMGHVDHGKSALLDYIRKSNVVSEEAGGITQHISAYEIEHEHEGDKKKITFIDTPGHAAFSAMRSRGANIADIAVLVVSAEDGVKTQTIEALNSIKAARIPYIVAINKIDLPAANVQSTQSSLIEHEIYIEGMGGDIPWVAISAKTGEGINDLLDMMLLIAEIEELTGDSTKRASGVVVESNRDTKRGITATLIIKNGVISTGQFVVIGASMAPVRIMEDFNGNKIDSATFSSPISLVGFDNLPPVGANFTVFDNKKDATLARSSYKASANIKPDTLSDNGKFVVPIILKADTLGSLEAIEHELSNLESDLVSIRILDKGIGTIGESDIKIAISKADSIVLAFNTKVDATSTEVARQYGIVIKSFDIIYELVEWLDAHITERRPKVEMARVVGEAKTLANFSENRQGRITVYTIGGRVISGQMRSGNKVQIYTHDNQQKGSGEILTLQSGKAAVDNVNIEQEFGAQIKTEIEITKGDVLKCIELVME